MESTNKDYSLSLLSVVATLFRYRKKILGITIISGVVTVILAFAFLPNYYQSTTIFYPASPDLFKPEQVGNDGQRDIDYFGEEEDVDRTLTIASSNEIYDFLIKRFQLYKHYEIDSTHILASFKVREALSKLYEVKKNKHNAIELSVEDRDPRLAAEMCNAAREKVNEILQRLIKESQWKQLETFEHSFEAKQNELTKIGDTLSTLRQNFGVYDPDKQGETVAEIAAKAKANLIRAKAELNALEQEKSVSRDTIALLRARMKGYEQELKEGATDLQRFNAGLDPVASISQQAKQTRFQMSIDKERYNMLKAAFSSKISALHVTDVGQVPVQKSRPKRSIMMLTAMILAFVMSLIAALVFDAYKNVDWQSVLKDN
jgi:capsule polysaccharide export protein KpsE/RkpR